VIFERAGWMADAACRGMNPDLFFPERGGSTAEAKAVCAGCPVRVECLDYAITNFEKLGLWGGTSERQRRAMRRRRHQSRGSTSGSGGFEAHDVA
jgi:WhiB family redox-sensing transcriptional regulator